MFNLYFVPQRHKERKVFLVYFVPLWEISYYVAPNAFILCNSVGCE